MKGSVKMFLWIGSNGLTAEVEQASSKGQTQSQVEELLFNHMQLKDDPRRENDFNNWIDEAAEAETALIATYIERYDIPGWLAEILINYDYTTEQFQRIVAELKGETEIKAAVTV